MLTLSLCVHRKTANRCHILEWKLEGKLTVFFVFFHQHQSHHQLVDSVGRKMCVYVCVFVWVWTSVCLRGCMPTCFAHGFKHMHRFVSMFVCCVSMHLWVSMFTYSYMQIRKGSTGNSELKTGKNKSCFLIFPASVCMCYISRWERKNTAEQRARSLHETKKQNHLPCSLQEGSITAGWKDGKNTSLHLHNALWKYSCHVNTNALITDKYYIIYS